jgi:hypothetical protein
MIIEAARSLASLQRVVARCVSTINDPDAGEGDKELAHQALEAANKTLKRLRYVLEAGTDAAEMKRRFEEVRTLTVPVE